MTNIGYRKVNYEIKLVNKTVNFLKRIIQKTYRITKVISKCGVVRKVTIGFITVVVALLFGSEWKLQNYRLASRKTYISCEWNGY